MVKFIEDFKINRFLDKLEKSIEKCNTLNEGYTITGLTRKTSTYVGRSKFENQLVFEKALSEREYYYFYNMKKFVSVPVNLDVTTMKIEKIECDFEKLRAILRNKDVKCSISKNNTNIIEHPTIAANKGNVYVKGLETDYIYPVVKQNNPDSPISDEDLNAIIKNSKKATELLESNKNLAEVSNISNDK